MKTVAFIPLKLNNERLPGKNTKCFDDGTPLVALLFKKLLALKGHCIDEIYVYCSDEKILSYIPEGIEFLKRPAELDRSETKGTEIYQSFVKTVDADVYILAHATSPFVQKKHIQECVEAVQRGAYDSAFCAKKLQTFLWKNNKPLNFTLNDPPRTQDMEPIYTEITTPYVFSKECFQTHGARTGVKPYICPCSDLEAVDIDHPEDFEFANLIYMHNKTKPDGEGMGIE